MPMPLRCPRRQRSSHFQCPLDGYRTKVMRPCSNEARHEHQPNLLPSFTLCLPRSLKHRLLLHNLTLFLSSFDTSIAYCHFSLNFVLWRRPFVARMLLPRSGNLTTLNFEMDFIRHTYFESSDTTIVVAVSLLFLFVPVL
ncbi:hypothetical protein P8452_62243 [Trifolium repens]|nr:hypothetical protein P8452_62243 [Trifolium repens]